MVTEEDFIEYIGPRAENYLVKFKKFQATATDGFALTWHWPAFIFGFWWLLYRKLYVWALVALGLWLIPHLALPAWFVWGAVANYLVLSSGQTENWGIPKSIEWGSARSVPWPRSAG